MLIVAGVSSGVPLESTQNQSFWPLNVSKQASSKWMRADIQTSWIGSKPKPALIKTLDEIIPCNR